MGHYGNNDSYTTTIRYLSVLRSAIRNNVRIPKRELVKKYNRNNDLVVIDVMII